MTSCSKLQKTKCSLPCMWMKDKGCRNSCPKGKILNPATGRCKKAENKKKEKTLSPYITCQYNQIPMPDGQSCTDIELVDSGTYGCVMTPAIIESKYIVGSDVSYEDRANNDISKIYKSGYKHYKKELEILQFVKKIDPLNKFTTKLKAAQHISSRVFDDKDSEMNYCLSHRKQKTYYQIILENGGNKLTDKYQLSYRKFVELFKPFLKGLIVLHKNNIVHRDIKPANVLIKKTKISLIDFGLSCSAKDVYNAKSMHVLSYHYPWYPPEFYIAGILLHNTPPLDSILSIMHQEGYFAHSFMTPSLKYIYEYGISKFIASIKTFGYTKFTEIFTPELAMKADVFPIAHLLSALSQNIIFDNSEQKIFIESLYNRCIDCNPYTRISLKDLYDAIK